MKKGFAAACLVGLVLGIYATPVAARGRTDRPTAPGSYTQWNGEIDELEVVRTFRTADYSKVVVVPFDVADTPLPDKDDNTYEPVKRVLREPSQAFAEGLSGELDRRLPVSRGGAAEERALVVRIKVVTMDPGSRAARYWGGFGAGAARCEVAGEIVEASSGQTLLRFKQERRSGWGAGGGAYEKLMNKNLQAIGEDVAGILKAF